MYLDPNGIIHWDLGEVPGTDDPVEYDPVCGREIYEEHSLSGLNKIPVVVLMSYILAGVEVSGKDIYNVTEFCERRLVDGRVVWYNGEFLDYVVEARSDFVRVRNELEGYVLEFTKQTESTWFMLQYKLVGGPGEYVYDEGKHITDGAFSAKLIKIYSEDQGVLFWAQRQYRQIERRANRLDRNMMGSALSNIITGYIGNVEQAKQELNKGKRNVFISSKDAKVTRVGSTQHSDQLLNELRELIPIYMLHCRVVDASEGANTSGAARRLKMSVMLQYVKNIRSDIQDFYAPTPVKFDALQVSTADELVGQLEFYDGLLARGAIDELEHQALCRALIA